MLGLLGTGMLFSETVPDLLNPTNFPQVPKGERRVRKAAPEQPIVPPSSLPIPDDAIHFAWEDIRNVNPFDHPFTRYIFIPEGDKDKRYMRITSLCLNYISRASSIIRPLPIRGGLLLRIDLRWYAPKIQDLKDWIETWEELAFDPSFSLLLTKDTINFAGIDHSTIPKQRVKKIKSRRGIIGENPDGSPIFGIVTVDTWEEVPTALGQNVDVVRFNPDKAIESLTYQNLQLATRTLAPVVDHRYFKARSMNSVKGKGVFAKVYGGLYYEFAGIKKAKDVLGQDTKATDLDLFFENIGIGNIKGALTVDRLFDKLRSDQGMVVFRSDVTGKPRDIWSFNTPNGKEGSGWGAITGDVTDSDIDIGDRAFANLLTPRRKAREAIFPRPTGLLLFGLFNGDGARQDEVPPDIAPDHTIPNPHTKVLQAGAGCIRCHGFIGSDGWQPIKNDLTKLLSGRLDIFDDRGLRRRIQSDIIDRIAGRYTGNFSKNLRRARDDVAEATLKATGPWEGSEDQTDVARLAAQRLHDEYKWYWWNTVDAKAALADLGLKVDPRHANKIYNAILPPELTSFRDGHFPEDPRIGAISSGLAINRSDWALSYSFAAERVRKNPVWIKLREKRK